MRESSSHYEEEEEEILGSDDDEQEDPKDYCKGTSPRSFIRCAMIFQAEHIVMLQSLSTFACACVHCHASRRGP